MEVYLYCVNHIKKYNFYSESKEYSRKLEIQTDFPVMFTFVSKFESSFKNNNDDKKIEKQ